MSKEIYISTTPHETRLAIVEDEQLAEIHYERENEYTLAGSIYNGKVTRVLPGMQSAFVDVGLERDAFLYVTDFMEEQGDAAEFDADGGSRRQPSRDNGRENGNAARGGGRRPRTDDAAAETETITSFDEPVAPAQSEEIATLDAGAGSRRWRGRRGRRPARGMRDELPASPAGGSEPSSAEDDAVIEGGYLEEIDAAAGAIEINLSSEAEPEPSEQRPPRENHGRRPEGRNRNGRGDRSRSDRPAPMYDNSYAGYDSGEALPPASGEPVVLPGESIRKYRDPTEVAAEDLEAKRNSSAPAEVITVALPSVEITGWDGGVVLPGESLSRHARANSRPGGAPARQAKQATDAIPEESFAQPEPVPTAVPEPTSAEGEPDGTDGAQVIEAVEVEFEPGEGASASVTHGTRNDLRRYEQLAEPQTLAGADMSDVAASDELAAASPDQTTYDLHASGEESTAVEERPEPQSVQPELEPNLTTLQATGEMLSAPQELDRYSTEEGAGSLPAQDVPGSTQPIAHEGAVESASLDSADTLPLAVEYTDETGDDARPAIHAYGDGDLQEEEIEGEVDGDEFEYDAAPTTLDDGEAEEYEEETLQDGVDMGSVLHEMSLDGDIAREDDGGESAMPGIDMAEEVDQEDREEDAPAEGAPVETESNGQERRARRSPNGRERRGSWNGGGDRGRGGRRQTMQMTDLPAINELLKPGQQILVQIAKEPIALKGARITSHIALPGRFLVFMPTVNHTGVSRKISSDEERRRLKSILLSEKGDAQGGFIVRTAAASATEEELRNDLRFLIHLWNDIKVRSESSKSPALIYHDLNLVERILRDQVTDNFSAIWVDTEQEYERVLRFLQRFQPALVRRVKLYTKETPLFEHFNVTPEIDKALKSKVWLKSGGSIVIDQTEALVAIDINTGKYVGKTARLEDTILKTNLDAIPEIVRQIRLRDLGGIIVIDFIDMDERKNRAKVLQALEDAMRTDRAPSKILPFNDFGLVIMTRKRVKQSLVRTLCMPDPVTEGTGMIKSPVTIANEIYVEMRKIHRHLEKTDVLLRVHPEVVKTLKANGGRRLQELEEMTHKTILVKSDPVLSPEAFDIN